MESLLGGCIMHELTPFDYKKVIKVSFVNMCDSESVNFGVAWPWLLLDHDVHNGFSSVICELVANGIIDELNMCLDKGVLFGLNSSASTDLIKLLSGGWIGYGIVE
jgi:hypothetical protein